MIDLGLLRDEPERIIRLLQAKNPAFDAQMLLDLDEQVRKVRVEAEELRNKKNTLAKEARGGVTPEVRAQSIDIGKRLKVKEIELEALQTQFKKLYLTCPNIPQNDVPLGDETANKVVVEHGAKPSFTFTPKHHVELGGALGWFDFEAGAKLAGSHFAFYRGDAVRLMYALSMFMLKHNQEYGFDLVLPSVLINEQSLQVSGNFPKFADQVYAMPEDKLYLSPTAEVNLANIYRDHIFQANELPIRMTAWTSCFRREAGHYGATERGLIRIHQFEKVELYTLCEPQCSSDELDRMLDCAQSLLKKLGLHYRVSLLSSQECSFQSAKTYDIEVWLPGQNAYYEVSSCSNCTDFQARRGLMRYKEQSESKAHLVHTLNGSSLALPRLMVALMEVYQQPDGSINMPEILKKEALFG